MSAKPSGILPIFRNSDAEGEQIPKLLLGICVLGLCVHDLSSCLPRTIDVTRRTIGRLSKDPHPQKRERRRKYDGGCAPSEHVHEQGVFLVAHKAATVCH